MQSQFAHEWAPIMDLPADWRSSLVDPQTAAMVQVWREQAGELREKDLYKNFLAKLQRQWAIETGVLEGLYTLSEGATLALIEKGLDASLITHDDTDQSPEDVIVKIRDQHHAILGLYQFVSGQRPLGTSYIKELHQVLTAHQEFYMARDTLGNFVRRPLPRGEWKMLSNNVEHVDGTKFEFCPPEHVAQEMDNLVAWHRQHTQAEVQTDVEAAWLHHRFTLIHPFTDGNGRVARCLATLVMLRAFWLPLVVTRRERTDYIAALRAADSDNLRPLVDLFGVLQRRAIREALSLTEDVIRESSAIRGILDSVKNKFSKQRAVQQQLVKRAIGTADSLQILAKQRLAEVEAEVHQTISKENPNYKAFMFDSPRDSEKSKFHYHQIVQCAKSLGYFADRRRYLAWAALAILTEHRTELLFSFHGIGHEASGILGCVPMAYTKERAETGESTIAQLTPLANEPFEFTYVEDPADVQRRFRRWLDECVLRGLDFWQKTL